MKDILINRDFDVEIDHRNDLSLAEGRREFEQHIAIGVTRFYYDEIGSLNRRNATSRLRLHAQRLVNQSDRVDELVNIIVEQSDESPNTVEVSLLYGTGETFDFEIS